jgi:glycosyltransferase involved in cell wall biosynthesis
MKIAYIVPYVPNRVRTRPYNLISQLASLGHEVDVFTVGAGHVDRDDAESLRARCSMVYFYEQPVWRSLLNSAMAVPTGVPLQSVYSLQADLMKHLKGIFQNGNGSSSYDVIHVEHLRGSEYGRILKSNYPRLPVIWDSVDCISHLFRQAAGQSSSLFGRMISRLELERTQKAESRLITLFDHVLVTSSVDQKELMSTLEKGEAPAQISVLSNGVDQDHFKRNPDVRQEPDTLVFSGKMSYHANISMVKYLVYEIMPLVWRHRPHVRLFVVGKDPSAEVKRMMENPLIHITGTVGDIRPYLWKSMVAVAPLVYGAGIQNKILEAMAVGLPVVTTSKALLSLGVRPGREVLIGDTPAKFSESVLKLLENPGMGCEMGEAGRAFVQENHDWRKIAEELVLIYNHSIHRVSVH